MISQLLVCGGAGFIGSAFVRYVLENAPNTAIRVYDKFTYAANPETLASIRSDRLQAVEGDICDLRKTWEAAEGADAIVNFAAETHNDRAVADNELFVRTNIEGTRTLLEVARQLQIRFHQVSTDEVYGTLAPAEAPAAEDHLLGTTSPYAKTKLTADFLVNSYHDLCGLHTTISRGTNTFGPYQHPEKFIPRQITNIFEGDVPVLYGSGLQIRDWIYVEDHARAIWEILTHGAAGEIYNVSASMEHTNLEVASMINFACKKPQASIRHIGSRPYQDGRYALDASKIKRELGWRPQYTNFQNALQQTIDWYKHHRKWWKDAKADAEQFYVEHLY